MINSSFNNSSIRNTNFVSNGYKAPTSDSTSVKDAKIDVKDTVDVSKTKEKPSKVETIKAQIADGSYKLLDSKTLASSFVKAEF